MSVFNFGSINIDHVYQVPHLVQAGETLASNSYQSILGGKGANQSIALAKAGMDTKHVGAIGSTDTHYIANLKAADVDCTHIRSLSDVTSGHAIIQVDDNAENSILLYGGANQAISEDQVALALLHATSDDFVLIQNETNALDKIIQHAASKDMRIVFNPAPMHESVKSLPLNSIDLLIVNEVEAEQLTGKSALADIKTTLLSLYKNTRFVITLGKQGACYVDQQQDIHVDAFVVDAVDTTAAGDTFIGYFLASMQQSKSIEESLKIGCAASALAVMTSGASSSIPSTSQVNRFLAEHAQNA